MEIFNLVNDIPTVSPEGLYIPELRKIWERDKSKNKIVAQAELVIIYHLVDPRSVYANQSSEDRVRLVLEDYAPENWTKDTLIEEAMEKYEILIKGPDTRHYEALRKAQDAMTVYLTNTTVKGGKDGNIAQVQASMKDAAKVFTSLEEAKKAADKEVTVKISKLKGNVKFGIGIMD